MEGTIAVKDSRNIAKSGFLVSLKDVTHAGYLKEAIAKKFGHGVMEGDFELVVLKAKASGGMETPQEALDAAKEDNKRWIPNLLAPLGTVGITAGSTIIAHFADGASGEMDSGGAEPPFFLAASHVLSTPI
jgi:hypothetical protein